MKKSELRKLIQEQIKNLYEQPSSFVCMNLFSTADAIDDGQSGLNSSEGYCVNTVIGSGGSNFESLFDQFQNAGFGTYTMHSTLEECISNGVDEACGYLTHDDMDVEFGMEYDGKVYLESINISRPDEMVDRVLKEINNKFKIVETL